MRRTAGLFFPFTLRPETSPDLAPAGGSIVRSLASTNAIGSAAIGPIIPEGQRNDTLTSLAGTMRRRGMGFDEIEAALLVTNNKRCDPPLAEDEIRKIAASVRRYKPAG